MNWTTDKLLDRAYILLKKEQKQRKTFIKPEISNHNRKSYITNFMEFSESIDREPEHIRKYLSKDMNVDISFTKEDNFNSDDISGLKFNNMFKSQQIMNSITNYMKQFVLCELCKSGLTEIIKIDRINYLKCNGCKANKAINNE
jgi:translation initiation factor 2 subunit 2